MDRFPIKGHELGTSHISLRLRLSNHRQKIILGLVPGRLKLNKLGGDVFYALRYDLSVQNQLPPGVRQQISIGLANSLHNMVIKSATNSSAQVRHGKKPRGGLMDQKLKYGIVSAGDAPAQVAGILGPSLGYLRFQLLGITGYAAAFPVVCLLLAILFGRAEPGGAVHPFYP